MQDDLPPPAAVTMESNAFWRWFPAGMRRRWWLFRLFDLACRYLPLFKKRRGLAVIRMDGIGDMVLFRPSLEHYAKTFDVDPSDITIIGCVSWKSIAGEVFAGYRVISINEHAYARKPLYRLRINLKMRLLAPQTVVSDAYFRRALMADSLVWVTGAPQSSVSYPYINEPTRAEFTWYLSQCHTIVDTGAYPRHELDRHAAFVSHFAGKTIKATPPRLPWRTGKPPLADGAPYVVLNPGSNEYGRRWPLDNYVSLSKWVSGLGYRAVFVGKADEKAHADLISETADGQQIIDMTGKTDLPGLMDLLRSAALVVSNDTGPLHLAIGLGAPTVAIVGGGHFGSFVPYPAHATPNNVRFIHEKMDCYHCFWRCHKRDDAKASFPCVAAVSISQVEAACRELLPA
ncbi:MAG: glycosyltransferase family 9 protein [Rhodospirillales bacterium]|nr:glycosyltransferase family 9 protein [Rhodospirillales bacterium]